MLYSVSRDLNLRRPATCSCATRRTYTLPPAGQSRIGKRAVIPCVTNASHFSLLAFTVMGILYLSLLYSIGHVKQVEVVVYLLYSPRPAAEQARGFTVSFFPASFEINNPEDGHRRVYHALPTNMTRTVNRGLRITAKVAKEAKVEPRHETTADCPVRSSCDANNNNPLRTDPRRSANTSNVTPAIDRLIGNASSNRLCAMTTATRASMVDHNIYAAGS